MKRVLVHVFSLLAAVAVVGLGATPAQAQIAAALGKPLPSPDLPAGTVSIRVIAGSPANPVTGTDVTLNVNGTPRQARTDDAGRVFFKDLPAGATVQAKVLDDDQKEVTSDEFPLPADSGVRLLLTTRPFEGGGMGGAPFAGGAAPEPRQMSGTPRPEQSDTPGTFTVRLTYDDFQAAPPVGIPVTLVGYAADDSVVVQRAVSDKDGRAHFVGLDRSGATAYFAMAQLPRNGAIDRLVAQPAVLDPRFGVRLILSSAKRDATDPPIDDITKLEKQDPATPEGQIRVGLEGAADPASKVTLYDASTRKVVAEAVSSLGAPDPSNVQASAQFAPKADLPKGTLDVHVHGGAGATDGPIAGVALRVVPVAPGGKPAADGGIASETDDSGAVRMALQQPAGQQLVAVLTINGKEMTSQAFDLSHSGGTLDVAAHWDAQGRPEATFTVAPAPDLVLYAETTLRGQHYRSIPFQPVAGRGTRVSLFVYPRVLFSFSLTSHIDDAFLAVSGRFDVSNNSWSPYLAGPDGMVVPLPRGFKGAIVAEQDQADVSVDKGAGFRIVRPIPPGSRSFHAGFSLPVEQGAVHWNLDLPFGAFQSGMEILQVPGMSVQLPPNVQGKTMTVPQGTFFVLPQISILPRQAMVMTIRGLPSEPAWRVWLPRVIGILVVLVMLGGLGVALLRRPVATPVDRTRAARRAALLDELVALEQDGAGGAKTEKRKATVLAELEELWEDGPGPAGE